MGWIWMAVPFIAPIVGAFTPPDAWYAGLTKPSWNPPGWLFGPVWTILYLLMGIAAWLVSSHSVPANTAALAVFSVQLVLNAAWTPVFFGFHALGAALVVIVLLLMGIAATIVAFWQIDHVAAALLFPYIAWVSFATLLNWKLWRLNASRVR